MTDPAPDPWPAPAGAAATLDPVGNRPVVRLKPRAPAQRLRQGAPWAWADQVVMDRRTRALAPGSIVRLEDGARAPIGTAAFHPGSKIAVRLLDRDPAARIDRAWLARVIGRAARIRATLYPTPHYRLIHAEADGLPGVVVDRYGDLAVIQPNAAWAEALVADLAGAIAQGLGIARVWKNAAGRARTLEGLDDRSGPLIGAAPDGPIAVPMNGATYWADVTGGQKTGLFYDQRENHAFAARLAAGRSVMDLFCHVGGFGLAALAAGAVRAVGVDASAEALALARRGAAAGGQDGRFETRQADAFAALAAARDAGESYGLVIADPPAFAPHKGAVAAGLRAYGRVARGAAQLVAPEGFLVLCSCSHAVEAAAFRRVCLDGIARAGRRALLLHEGRAGPDHPVHPDLAESAYLKAFFFRLD